jgi:2-oxoglutarate dehydrogenase E2 component (dihydrolipoamide succinyltransferase)
MKNTILAPSVGESVTEVSILKWAIQNGQPVQAGQVLLEIESDKATVEIVSEFSGVLSILKTEGERVAVGEALATIDEQASGKKTSPVTIDQKKSSHKPSHETTAPMHSSEKQAMPGPAARKKAEELGIDLQNYPGTGKDGRVTKGDLLDAKPTSNPSALRDSTEKTSSKPTGRRVPMSHLRARIAERLVQAQQTAAILTTFNEVDMTRVMEIRKKHKTAFESRHGVSLGFMSFFARATMEAMKIVPEINASIEGREIVYHDSVHLGVAVGTERGLVVPVIHEAQNLSFSEIEQKLAELAEKARSGKLSIANLSGGTFTISNGGVYGSLMSTPILTPPQSAILGMHKIQPRPIACEGKVEIRPMMYLALSYDHRLIDGKGAVTFLVQLKEGLESPEKIGWSFQ